MSLFALHILYKNHILTRGFIHGVNMYVVFLINNIPKKLYSLTRPGSNTNFHLIISMVIQYFVQDEKVGGAGHYSFLKGLFQ